MALFQEGDEDAFLSLYERYRDRIYRFIQACYEKNASLVEEYAQEVFVKVIRSKSAYDPTKTFSTWLFAIARNHCLNRLAAAPRRFEMLRAQVDENEIVSKPRISELERGELNELIQSSVVELPELQRTIFIMRELEELPHKDIARALGLSENNARTQYHRAKKQLRTILKPYLEAKYESQ